MDTITRHAYDSDVSDEEWAFLAPYLTLMREDAPLMVLAIWYAQRPHPHA